jgi:hypothetical protein
VTSWRKVLANVWARPQKIKVVEARMSVRATAPAIPSTLNRPLEDIASIEVPMIFLSAGRANAAKYHVVNSTPGV